MSLLILSSFEGLFEAVLWLMMLPAVVIGYTFGGVTGALILATVAAVIIVLVCGPIMMLSDIRISVRHLVHQGLPEMRPAGAAFAGAGPPPTPRPHRPARSVRPPPPPRARPMATSGSTRGGSWCDAPTAST